MGLRPWNSAPDGSRFWLGPVGAGVPKELARFRLEVSTVMLQAQDSRSRCEERSDVAADALAEEVRDEEAGASVRPSLREPASGPGYG